MLAADGFIVYDIQDEPGRTNEERPFPFRRVMDSSTHAALLSNLSGRECLVYKCVADASFKSWLGNTKTIGQNAINLVGRASSEGTYDGPTISEAMDIAKSLEDVRFGCVCIAERHTLEAAQERGKTYPTEHLNMLRKINAGANWFISQAVYDAEPTIRLLKDYATLCKQKGIVPRKVSAAVASTEALPWNTVVENGC
jgi:5,10-methylenetetrahydrofolate reductase